MSEGRSSPLLRTARNSVAACAVGALAAAALRGFDALVWERWLGLRCASIRGSVIAWCGSWTGPGAASFTGSACWLLATALVAWAVGADVARRQLATDAAVSEHGERQGTVLTAWMAAGALWGFLTVQFW